MFNINFARMTALAALMLCISACLPISSTPVPTEPGALPASTSSPTTAQPLLKTEQGDFMILSARLVDEVNGVKAQTDEKILLIILTQPGLAKLDPSEFSLEAFGNMVHARDVEIYILGNDGSQTISTMSGWVGDEFAMGFRVPAGVNTYTLHWTGNAPIVIHVEK